MDNKKTSKTSIVFFLWLVLILCPILPAKAEPKRALTVQDIMKFRSIRDTVISEDGLWVAFSAQPDRGDGEVRVQKTQGEKTYSLERGSKPVFAKNARWIAAAVKPKALEMEKAGKDKPKQGMALLDIRTGEVKNFEKVEKFAFSEDSSWLAYQFFKEEEKKEGKENAKEEKGETAKTKMKDVGTAFVLRHLESGKEIEIAHVLSFAFDKAGRYLAYAVAEPDGKGNGLFCRVLSQESAVEKTIHKSERAIFGQSSWEESGVRLAYVSAQADSQGVPGPAELWIWNAGTNKSILGVAAAAVPQDWVIPSKNRLAWSKDGKRLFFGLLPEDMFSLSQKEKKGEKADEIIDLFSLNQILEKREVDVWHWNDPRIIPHQKKSWPELKEKTYLAVYHTDSGKSVPLADENLPDVEIPDNPSLALGFSVVPYLKELTWDGEYYDVYLVDLRSGVKKKIISRLGNRPSLSPHGNFILYYREKNWHLYDVNSGAVRNLTAALKIPFFDEAFDRPDAPPSYGTGGWMEDESAVLLYDKFDIWQIYTRQENAACLTGGEGRKSDLTFRVLRLDPEEKFLKKGQELLLSAHHNRLKYSGFYSTKINGVGVERLVEEKKTYTFVAKAKQAESIIFTRESYEEFPDLWATDLKLFSPLRLTDINPQTKEFAWGSAELVEWQSLDGIPLQGVLIKPGNYETGKRYPVLVYFYELMSDRLCRFNQVVVNHRPCFPFYASSGYTLFLPDIVYETGRPGQSAVKCLLPGVQKLIDMGVADPKAIALHGHSWGGYETAFLITQTNLFRAAIAGAAVGNMTSGYSGIRWESGLGRQFQYEKEQSRIGGSLWEYPLRFIENSPVFFADRIQTPLLLMFGDEDGAVPWQQGIELYLAMRRLGKDCVFLQYRGEPHHPQKYANKLDYTIKMKEYLDHYLKGEPAPAWLSDGVPYLGK